jgi:hypothetical protein
LSDQPTAAKSSIDDVKGTDDKGPTLDPLRLDRGGSAALEDIPRFETHQYRITRVEFLDEHGNNTTRFRFGEPMRLRVAYECLLAEVPAVSCGLAVGVTSVPDHQAVMYFNTCYPHSDGEMASYHEQEFRRFHGRTGVIEARIPFVQLKPGEYLVSLGILPNRQELHEFYEYRHLAYRIAVLPNGFPEPSVFYAQVEWTHGSGN